MDVIRDVAFAGGEAIIFCVKNLVVLNRHGDTTRIEHNKGHWTVIRERGEGEVERIYIADEEVYQLTTDGTLEVPRHHLPARVSLTSPSFRFRVGEVVASARIAYRQYLNCVVSGKAMACVAFPDIYGFAMKPKHVSMWIVSEAGGEEGGGALVWPLRLHIRSNCPPVDLGGGIIAVGAGGRLLANRVDAGVLIHLPGFDHPVETCSVSSGGDAACVLRDKQGGLRAVLINLKEWLENPTAPARDMIRKIASIRFPGELTRSASFAERDVHFLRIAPTLDWGVAYASVLQAGSFVNFFTPVELEWTEAR